MIQGGYQYRFHSKLNRGFILGVTPYLNGLVGAVLQEYPRADPRYSVFVVKEVADKVGKDHPYQPGVYNLQLASSDSSAQTYLGFPMNYDNMNRGTVADGNQLCLPRDNQGENPATIRMRKCRRGGGEGRA